MVVLLGAAVTVDYLVTLIQQKAVLPNSPTLLPSSALIMLLDDEMRKKVFPMIKALKEEYWVTSIDNTILSTQASYQIPYRAVGAALRKVVMVDNNGNELKLTKYEPEDIQFPLIPTGTPYFPIGYYLKDNAVVLWPPVATNYTSYLLRLYYERRPSSLVSTSSCGQVTSNNGSSTLTLNFVPTSWTTSTTLDVINNIPPFNSIADDVVITAINGLTLTVSIPSTSSATFWTSVANNFWVAPSMTTPVPQIPYDAFPFLAALGTKVALSGVSDIAMMKDADQDIAEAKMLLTSALTPRVEASPKILSNRAGILDYSKTSGQWGGV